MERWTTPTLTGTIVRLEPLAAHHAADLFDASRDPRVWRWLPVLQPQTTVEWDDWMAAALERTASGLELAFATVSQETGAAIGSTRYLALRPEHRSLEIGWTWLSPAAWGTGANTEAKLLQLAHAFDVLGCRRVEFKTDALNERANPALAALPAVFEGTHRKHMLVRDGREPGFDLVQHRGRRMACRPRGTPLAPRLTYVGQPPQALALPLPAEASSEVPRSSPHCSHGRRVLAGERCASLRATTGLLRRPASLHSAKPGIPRNWSTQNMIESVSVIGSGRVGSAVSARLAERGLALDASAPDLVLLCVPDRAIADVANAIAPGPWVAHVSGATPLAALAPHDRRFSVHPLQTFTLRRGPEQLDGAWAAVTADNHKALAAATWLAETLGLRAFHLLDANRAAYHAGAAIAANYLVTLRHAAGALLEAAGAPRRGTRPADGEDDRERLRAHRPDRARGLGDGRAPSRGDPGRVSRARDAVPRPRGCHGGARVRVCRTISEIRTALEPHRDSTIGLVPTMGSLHAGHLSLIAAARSECSTVVMSLFVNPAQFGNPGDLNALPT